MVTFRYDDVDVAEDAETDISKYSPDQFVEKAAKQILLGPLLLHVTEEQK
jgi:hypothetical protein